MSPQVARCRLCTVEHRDQSQSIALTDLLMAHCTYPSHRYFLPICVLAFLISYRMSTVRPDIDAMHVPAACSSPDAARFIACETRVQQRPARVDGRGRINDDRWVVTLATGQAALSPSFHARANRQPAGGGQNSKLLQQELVRSTAESRHAMAVRAVCAITVGAPNDN